MSTEIQFTGKDQKMAPSLELADFWHSQPIPSQIQLFCSYDIQYTDLGLQSRIKFVVLRPAPIFVPKTVPRQIFAAVTGLITVTKRHKRVGFTPPAL